ncbi:hypothetical protein RvY_08451 [Ramazzottius varieornatus]|uniref:Syndecan/Neurexin domain-containing protein n=1 Tax=Ramazzottius varieornatus TaxID=947166 RepID=A0A1D1VF22_RAMVA|nr:hypothetical protein RvY_08451 [Ramazzottius varieornatus]
MGRWWVTVACMLISVTSLLAATAPRDNGQRDEKGNVAVQQPNTSATAGSPNNVNHNDTNPENLPTRSNVTMTQANSKVNTSSVSIPVKRDDHHHFAVKLPPSNSTEHREAILAETLAALTNLKLAQRKSANSTTLPAAPAATTSANSSHLALHQQNVSAEHHSDPTPSLPSPDMKLVHINSRLVQDPKVAQMVSSHTSWESPLYSTRVALGFFVVFTLALLIGSVLMYRRMHRMREEDRTVFSSTSYGDLRNHNYDLAL